MIRRLASDTLELARPPVNRVRHRRDLEWVAQHAPRVTATLVAPGPWRTERTLWSGTGHAVAVVSSARSRDRFVVKAPSSPDGEAALRQQATTLADLAGAPQSAPVRPLLPRTVGHGDVDGRFVSVEQEMPGTPVERMLRGGNGTGRRALASAAEAIGAFHDASSVEVTVGDAELRSWVAEPVQTLTARLADDDRRLAALRRLEDRLAEGLGGRTIRTAWVHGDFWAGNLLANSNGDVTGIMDWDQSVQGLPPLHDLMHLHVFARRQTHGLELGHLVVGAVRTHPSEALGVPRSRLAAWTDGLEPRVAVLAYWLRHAALFLDHPCHQSRYWLRHNVHRVLDAV